MIPSGQVNPRGQRVTDQQLREDLVQGLSQARIARKHGVSEAAVSQRVKRLNLQTSAAAVAPAESGRFCRRTIDAMEHLVEGLDRVTMLRDACHEWLQDPDDPSKYNVSPRAHEVEVVYQVRIPGIKAGEFRLIKRRKRLSALLAMLARDTDGAEIAVVDASEARYSDPRKLILETVQETRGVIQTAADLAETMASMRTMETLRELVLDEIRRCDPEMRERIVDRLQRALAVNTYIGGAGAIPDDPTSLGSH